MKAVRTLARSWRQTSKPSISGIITSSRMTSGCPGSDALERVCSVPAVSTSMDMPLRRGTSSTGGGNRARHRRPGRATAGSGHAGRRVAELPALHAERRRSCGGSGLLGAPQYGHACHSFCSRTHSRRSHTAARGAVWADGEGLVRRRAVAPRAAHPPRCDVDNAQHFLGGHDAIADRGVLAPATACRRHAPARAGRSPGALDSISLASSGLMRQHLEDGHAPSIAQLAADRAAAPAPKRVAGDGAGAHCSAAGSGSYGSAQCSQTVRTSRCAMITCRERGEHVRRDAEIEQARDTVATASLVCSVLSTRWPVCAAWTAISAVSRSRISPTRMTSGSWRRMERSVPAKVRPLLLVDCDLVDAARSGTRSDLRW